MTPFRLILPALAIAALLPGCATPRIPAEASQIVIHSLIQPVPESPWRLGVAWLPGGMGGTATRAAGIEQVVHRKPLQVSDASAKTPRLFPLPPSYSDDEVERAWRKFCRNRLDMTERDRQIIRDTPVPLWAFGNCHTAILLK